MGGICRGLAWDCGPGHQLPEIRWAVSTREVRKYQKHHPENQEPGEDGEALSWPLSKDFSILLNMASGENWL